MKEPAAAPKQTYHEQQIAQAILEGFEVYVAKGPDITLDMDGPETINEQVLEILQKTMAITLTRSVSSKTVGHRHTYLRADRDLTELERCFIQLALGSDPKREAIGFVRILTDDTPISVLFEKSAKPAPEDTF